MARSAGGGAHIWAGQMILTYLSLAIIGLLWGGIFLLMAEGLNLIYGVMKVVNVAHGDFIVVGGLFAVTLFGTWGLTPLLSFLLSGLLLFAVGAAVEAGILERLHLGEARGELRTLLATFGLSYMVSNAAFLIWGAQFQSIPFLQGSLRAGALSVPQGLLALALIALVVALCVQLWLTRTLTGRMVRATASSELGAATCGLDTRRLRMVTFALGSAMAGAAGALTIALIPFQAVSGPLLTVQAFTVIALGGLGNYTGAMLAALLIGLTEVWTSYFFGSNVASAVIYAVFIAVLVFRPQGLLGRAGRI
jgi:branched-chain amino acid transport system permease protein